MLPPQPFARARVRCAMVHAVVKGFGIDITHEKTCNSEAGSCRHQKQVQWPCQKQRKGYHGRRALNILFP